MRPLVVSRWRGIIFVLKVLARLKDLKALVVEETGVGNRLGDLVGPKSRHRVVQTLGIETTVRKSGHLMLVASNTPVPLRRSSQVIVLNPRLAHRLFAQKMRTRALREEYVMAKRVRWKIRKRNEAPGSGLALGFASEHLRHLVIVYPAGATPVVEATHELV